MLRVFFFVLSLMPTRPPTIRPTGGPDFVAVPAHCLIVIGVLRCLRSVARELGIRRDSVYGGGVARFVAGCVNRWPPVFALVGHIRIQRTPPGHWEGGNGAGPAPCRPSCTRKRPRIGGRRSQRKRRVRSEPLAPPYFFRPGE